MFRFLEEQHKKAKSWEIGKNTETNDVNMKQGKANDTIISDSVSRKYNKDNDSEVSMNSYLKVSPFLSARGEEEEEMVIKPQSKSFDKAWHNEDECLKPKSKVTHSARELFEERFGKGQAYSRAANSDMDATAEDLYLSQRQDKVAAVAAALTKRELVGKFEELSPDMGSKAKRMAKSPSILFPIQPPAWGDSDREMFMIRRNDSPFMSSRKQEAKMNVRMDFRGDSLIG